MCNSRLKPPAPKVFGSDACSSPDSVRALRRRWIEKSSGSEHFLASFLREAAKNFAAICSFHSDHLFVSHARGPKNFTTRITRILTNCIDGNWCNSCLCVPASFGVARPGQAISLDRAKQNLLALARNTRLSLWVLRYRKDHSQASLSRIRAAFQSEANELFV